MGRSGRGAACCSMLEAVRVAARQCDPGAVVVRGTPEQHECEGRAGLVARYPCTHLLSPENSTSGWNRVHWPQGQGRGGRGRLEFVQGRHHYYTAHTAAQRSTNIWGGGVKGGARCKAMARGSNVMRARWGAGHGSQPCGLAWICTWPAAASPTAAAAAANRQPPAHTPAGRSGLASRSA